MAFKDQITGVVVRDNHVEWSILQRRKTAYDFHDHGHAVLDVDPDHGDTDAQDEWVADLKSKCGGISGYTCLGINSDKVLLRVVDLPSTDKEELDGMIELQVDKFSPFPAEHMVISHERLFATDTGTRVLIAAARSEHIEALGDCFASAGHPLKRIDLKVMGWWTLIKERGDIPKTGRHALILLDHGESELIVCQDGLPVLIRHLGVTTGQDSRIDALEIAEEFGYTLTSLESEWGAYEMPRLSIWHHGDKPPAEIVEAVKRETSVKVDTSTFDELPPVSESIARRTIDQENRMDLTPPEWHESERLKSINRRFITILASMLAVWIAGMGIFLISLNILHGQIERLQADVAALEGPAEEARQLRNRVESLEQYADRTYSALECLREVSEHLPPGVDLSSFVYRKGRAINLRGDSATVTPIYDFFDAIESSQLFQNVKLEGITQAAGGRRRPEFRMTITLPGDSS